MTERVRILNGSIDAVTLARATDSLIERARRGERGWVATINVAILMTMRKDGFLQGFAERACLSLADGQPLVWTGRLFGAPLPERVTGIDLMVDLCARAAQAGLPVYLLGAAPGVAREAAARLKAQFPGLRVAGTADGYFPDADAQQRARAVRESGAAILFVAMGVPRQERFIEQHWEALGASVVVPVGGSFDVLADRVARAPRLLQKLGLEWAFRLAQEPRRLWRRYLVTNAAFVTLVCAELVLGQRTRRPI